MEWASCAAAWTAATAAEAAAATWRMGNRVQRQAKGKEQWCSCFTAGSDNKTATNCGRTSEDGAATTDATDSDSRISERCDDSGGRRVRWHWGDGTDLVCSRPHFHPQARHRQCQLSLLVSTPRCALCECRVESLADGGIRSNGFRRAPKEEKERGKSAERKSKRGKCFEMVDDMSYKRGGRARRLPAAE